MPQLSTPSRSARFSPGGSAKPEQVWLRPRSPHQFHSHLSLFTSHFPPLTFHLWLSVDPLSDKYPGASPYVYCADNPVRLVDVDGREVEYASFADRLIVGLERIFNSHFRKTFQKLKESKETYVFRKHLYNEESSFTCEGSPNNAKLYINYGMGETQKNARETIFSQLCHESEHARQFEDGELGFVYSPIIIKLSHFCKPITVDRWTPFQYDLTDEIKAHEASTMGFRWKVSEYGAQNSEENKRDYLKKAITYSKLPEYSRDITFPERRKDSHAYYLPHK